MLVIYTDGAIRDNTKAGKDARAAWGFVAVERAAASHHAKGEEVHAESGPVVTDPADERYLGAEIGSNNTAELTAIIQGALWAIKQQAPEVVIFTDSKYAKKVLQGEYGASKNRELVRYGRRVLYGNPVVTFKLKWVKGHVGIRFNERADELAGGAL